MGYESDQGEGENPDRQDEEEEIPFEEQEYDGDADIELADDDYNERIGTGAIVASVHAARESGDEKTRIAQVAQLATTGESESDQKIANELVSSINTVWNEAYIILVSCIDYALDMTCIQSVSQCFIVCGIL